MNLDDVYNNLPYRVARHINWLVHYKAFVHVLCAIKTKVVRIGGNEAGFIICENNNYYGVLAVLQ